MLDWSLLAPLLTSQHHVVGLDLRGHGESGDGEWSWANALADVAAVADAVGEPNPAIVGHSLGGMLAAMWGAAHPECPGVVNLDGHGRRRPDQFVGLAPAAAAAQIQELDDWLAGARAESAGPLDATQVDALLDQYRALAAKAGAPEEVLLAMARRGLRQAGDGTRLRPDPGGLAGEIMAAAAEFDMLDLYARLRCPLLIFLAEAPPAFGAVPSRVQELMARYRTGLARDLAHLAEIQANVRIFPVDASHALIIERPIVLAGAIQDFLASPPG